MASVQTVVGCTFCCPTHEEEEAVASVLDADRHDVSALRAGGADDAGHWGTEGASQGVINCRQSASRPALSLTHTNRRELDTIDPRNAVQCVEEERPMPSTQESDSAMM